MCENDNNPELKASTTQQIKLEITSALLLKGDRNASKETPDVKCTADRGAIYIKS
jgi:hypothetical protein